jgi:hypothetical protein
MLIIPCLIWIGNALEAPAWYYALLIITLVIKIISYGLDMYNKGKKERL